MTAARDKGIGVLSIIKRVVGERARKTNPICRCIDTTNEDVDHPRVVNIGYTSEYDYSLDVTFFPTWLEGTTSKPVEKSWNGLFSCKDLIGGEILERG